MNTRKALAVLAVVSLAVGTAPGVFAQTPTTGTVPVTPSKPAPKKTAPSAPAQGSATTAKPAATAPAKRASKSAKAEGASDKAAAPAVARTGPRSIVGEVVDPACWIVNGAKGASHKECAIACAKAGQVLAIVENKTQKLYMVATEKPGEDPNKGLLDYVGQTVLVRGRVYSRGGATGIKVSSVEPAGQRAGAE